LIKIPDSKNGTKRSFTIIVDKPEEDINYIETFQKYYKIREKVPDNPRFFLRYHAGKGANQPVGNHTFAKIPSQIASFLKLPEASLYIGHCFRRSGATLLAVAGKVRVLWKAMWQNHLIIINWK
jgi:hypothetical protein